MNKITPFLWFNDSAGDAAEFYLSVFPEAKKVGELRSSGVGPWPAGKIATVTIELMGQRMTFLTGAPRMRSRRLSRTPSRARTRPRSTATGTSWSRVAIPWPAAG
jgi:predicted 3-demethylubiquinone-9 3-methyltransferase (glyoxalase superfamily)